MSDNNPHKLQVGQKLYRVPTSNREGSGQLVIITKVGKIWATTGGYGRRVDLKDLSEDGGKYSSSAKYYLSEAHYVAERQRIRYWENLRMRFPAYATPDYSLEDMMQVAKILKIEVTND